jgi:diguanylate cyclase (GGDEF)-like protein
MHKEYNKNIIIIEDNLTNYIKSITEKNDLYNLIITKLETIENDLQHIKNKEKSCNLVIIDRSVYSDEVKKRLKLIFTGILGYSNPHILFLSNKSYSHEEYEKLMSEQNFFYHITKGEKFQTFYCYLALIMQHIEDLKRLDNYIIHSFQTIVNAELISEQKAKIENLYKQLETLSKIDVLTNVLNRRAFFEAMEVEKSRALRDLWRLQNSELKNINLNETTKAEIHRKFKNNAKGGYADHFGKFSCMMIDIDHFKLINDTYGHLAGDEVLRRLGTLLSLKTNFREIDIIGRYGGEEFIVLLPETKAKDAKKPAKRLSDSLKAIQFNFNKQIFSVTISIGISDFRITDTTSDDIIQRADKALYYAKNNGRDMIVVYEEVFKD